MEGLSWWRAPGGTGWHGARGSPTGSRGYAPKTLESSEDAVNMSIRYDTLFGD